MDVARDILEDLLMTNDDDSREIDIAVWRDDAPCRICFCLIEPLKAREASRV